MMNNDLTGLLNPAYEIEGLLMLHINRGEEASPEMKTLLIEKAGKLLAGLTGSPVATAPIITPPVTVAPEATPPEISVVREIRTTVSAPVSPEDLTEPVAAPHLNHAVASSEPEPPVANPAPAPASSKAPAAPVEAATASDKTEEKTDEEEIAANALAEERGDADVTVQTVNDTLGADSQLTLDEKLARQRAADISKAFTLNDRFRFRRELFRNSDEEFKETLEVIGSMASMEEAEDYFFNDLCWDESSPEVKEFMSIVAKHF